MSAASRARFAEVVRAEPVDLGLACLLVGAEIDPSLDVDEALARLDALAADARPVVPPSASASAAAEGLRKALGERAGFRGHDDDYGDLRSSLLHEVLRRGRGLPLLLSVVWVEVAARLQVPAYPVALPGHVVVGVGDPTADPFDGDHVHVDPFDGGRLLSSSDLERIVSRTTGGPLESSQLRPEPAADLLLRLLTNVRMLTTRLPPSLQAARTRLWAVELSLLLPRHPIELRRERGELLVRLGDHLGGARQLEEFAEVVEGADAQTASAVLRDARQARARLN
jgi:regulator of sirC expression with transglutaminase-like and TPR domain